MTGALRRLLGREQLALDFGDAAAAPAPLAPPAPARAPRPRLALVAPAQGPPRDAEELLARLRALGLTGIDRCRLTRNRTVMVSFKGGELRVHEGYLGAPAEVHRAIARFVSARRRAERRAAQAVLLAHPIARDTATAARRAREATHPDDAPAAARLQRAHRELNAHHFGGSLRDVPVRVSRRMRRRLGHYAPASSPEGAEIAIARSHLRRHGWDEALHTLLHEMVHQWQDESGLAVDHGRDFRRKAREVGITARAARTVGAGTRMTD